MKKLLILLLLPFYMQAQTNNRIIFKERKQVFEVVEQLLATTKNSYKLVEIDSVKCRSCISFTYSDSVHKLTAFFYKDKSKGNYDLGIPDTINYRFGGITGFYLDVFPFWKQFFQPEADMIVVQGEGHGKVITLNEANKTWIVTMNKEREAWMIDARFYK